MRNSPSTCGTFHHRKLNSVFFQNVVVFRQDLLILWLVWCDHSHNNFPFLMKMMWYTAQALFEMGATHCTELLRALLVPTMHYNVLMAAQELIACTLERVSCNKLGTYLFEICKLLTVLCFLQIGSGRSSSCFWFKGCKESSIFHVTLVVLYKFYCFHRVCHKGEFYCVLVT